MGIICDIVLRALQLIFAIVVMGMVGHAIYIYQGFTTEEHAWFGDMELYNGVPDSWSFLMFCAAWTTLGVLFLIITEVFFFDQRFVYYSRVAVEFVALLSWLAGFIAVAVNVSTTTCPTDESSCQMLKAATVFGAVEWLLFMITAIMTAKAVTKHRRQEKRPSSTMER